jgi:phage replication O-like protein O
MANGGHIRIDNDFWEALMKYRIPGEEMQVLMAIIRKTWGFGKKEDCISMGQIAEMTGLIRQHVNICLKKLAEKNLITVTKKSDSLANKYRLNEDFEKWLPVTKKGYCNQKRLQSVTEYGDKTVTEYGAHNKQIPILKDNAGVTKSSDKRFPFKKESFPPNLCPEDKPGLPKSFEAVIEHFEELGSIDPEALAKQYLNAMLATDWVDSFGRKIVSWFNHSTGYFKTIQSKKSRQQLDEEKEKAATMRLIRESHKRQLAKEAELEQA